MTHRNNPESDNSNHPDNPGDGSREAGGAMSAEAWEPKPGGGGDRNRGSDADVQHLDFGPGDNQSGGDGSAHDARSGDAGAHDAKKFKQGGAGTSESSEPGEIVDGKLVAHAPGEGEKSKDNQDGSSMLSDKEGNITQVQYANGDVRQFGYKEDKLNKITEANGDSYARGEDGKWSGKSVDGNELPPLEDPKIDKDGTFSYQNADGKTLTADTAEATAKQAEKIGKLDVSVDSDGTASYRVKSGDTLANISKDLAAETGDVSDRGESSGKSKLNPDEIARNLEKTNKIKDPDEVIAGSQLIIPNDIYASENMMAH